MNNITNLGKTFGKRLKKRCRDKGITQEKLKDLLKEHSDNHTIEVTLGTIKNWYGGKQLPRLATFYALCDLLDCSADYLLGIDEERNHDFEFIKQETGLNEKTLTALKKYPHISHTIDILVTTEYSNQDKYKYLLSCGTILNDIVDYLHTENTIDNPQASALKMLEIQARLTSLQTLVAQNNRAKRKKLF